MRKNTFTISGFVLFVAACAFCATVAAQRPTNTSNAGRRRQAAAKQPPVAKPSPSPAPASPPVVLVNNGQPEYLSGEANVSVKGNQNPIIRLGLAQNGVNIIEFPASDSFFMIHPGNSELVAFDQETAEKSRRSLVLRPGAAFVAPPQGGSATRGPSASISVQMQSGVVVTFLIYPVRELSQNAHRCVVMYNREEVVAARRAAGLAVNLDGKDPQPAKRDNGAVRFGDYGGSENQTDGQDTVFVSGRKPLLTAEVNSEQADERVRSGKVSKKKPKVSEAANRALKDTVKSPAKVGAFSKPNHGLSLAVAPAIDLDAQTRMLVVAVKSESKSPLRIVPGNPELYIQTFDDSGKSLQVEPVKKLHVESTSLEGKVDGGETIYYAIVYESPIMGARQRLRVSVSQTDAADEPAATSLGAAPKRK